jgi:hypothetical protein
MKPVKHDRVLYRQRHRIESMFGPLGFDRDGVAPDFERVAGAAYDEGPVLGILPFDRAANGRLLVNGCLTGARNRAHGLDKLSGRLRARRSFAAFVEPTAVLELAVGAVTEEVRRTHRPIRSRHCLGLVVQIRKWETMSLGEMLHIFK